jgi:hypothetical protein
VERASALSAVLASAYALEGLHFPVGFIDTLGNFLPGRVFCRQKPSASITVFNVSYVSRLVLRNNSSMCRAMVTNAFFRLTLKRGAPGAGKASGVHKGFQ